ncbi:unnamed protein product, partial [Mesorhabditis belari]|uniref:C-type lectin domain-containing protein n=1 Tax=Mesorhabditis belari TaxID=2138241 RepID=A0AAF3FPC4_9BILA
MHNYNEKVASTYKTKIRRIFGVDCPSGFDYFPEWQLCIGSTLKEGDGWTANEQSCFIEGGNLVAIHDAFYNNFIGTTALKQMGSYRVMIGLKQNGTVWEWVDGSAFDYQRWAPGEPSNKYGDEDCAYLDPNNNNWYSGECFYLTNFLCQIPLVLNK